MHRLVDNVLLFVSISTFGSAEQAPKECAAGEESREWGMRHIGITHPPRKSSKATKCGLCVVVIVLHRGPPCGFLCMSFVREERKDLKKLNIDIVGHLHE